MIAPEPEPTPDEIAAHAQDDDDEDEDADGPGPGTQRCRNPEDQPHIVRDTHGRGSSRRASAARAPATLPDVNAGGSHAPAHSRYTRKGGPAWVNSLRDMLTDLRAEIGHSTNVGVRHQRSRHAVLLPQPHAAQLYQDYDWPQLIVDRDVTLMDGQRYYPYPVDLAFDDIIHIWVLINTRL